MNLNQMFDETISKINVFLNTDTRTTYVILSKCIEVIIFFVIITSIIKIFRRKTKISTRLCSLITILAIAFCIYYLCNITTIPLISKILLFGYFLIERTWFIILGTIALEILIKLMFFGFSGNKKSAKKNKVDVEIKVDDKFKEEKEAIQSEIKNLEEQKQNQEDKLSEINDIEKKYETIANDIIKE